MHSISMSITSTGPGVGGRRLDQYFVAEAPGGTEAGEEMPSAVAAFRLLLLTGCRMSEIRDLRLQYVKRDCIELPDAKTGGRVVPLGPEAWAVLSAISREDDTPWVIAGRLPGSHLTDFQRTWRRIR